MVVVLELHHDHAGALESPTGAGVVFPQERGHWSLGQSDTPVERSDWSFLLPRPGLDHVGVRHHGGRSVEHHRHVGRRDGPCRWHPLLLESVGRQFRRLEPVVNRLEFHHDRDGTAHPAIGTHAGLPGERGDVSVEDADPAMEQLAGGDLLPGPGFHGTDLQHAGT